MNVGKSWGIILIAACLYGVQAQKNLDTIWTCHDGIPVGSAGELFFRMFLSDTFPDNRGSFQMVDTGASQDGSRYINFDYQFTNDSVHSAGKTSRNVDTVYDIGPRPGYAGFKMYWDNGFVQFHASEHDSMIFWHKGPLTGHKVKMIWAQGGNCGEPINYQYFGEFKSSTDWKRECMPFPEKRGYVSTYPDSAFVRNGLFELRMLIYNDEGTTSPTSAKGCLKLDNIGFIKAATGVADNPRQIVNTAGNRNYFVPAVSGKVTLAVYSLQGEQLYRGAIAVAAGKRYSVGQFARKNSNLPTKWIQIVKVNGAGVNITTKVCR